MKTVLFAWELGRGLGHLFTIRRMAVRLAAHGVRSVAAIADPESAGILRGACSEVVPAPAWPLARQAAKQRAAQSSATLNDILSAAGLADAAALRGLFVAWEEIIERFHPQLVIADFAPVAALVARGRVPLLQIGNGYTLPPDAMARFPPLHQKSPPQWNEDDTLSVVNEVGRSFGRTKLERLPQIFSGDARLVQTFALLDPYRTQRVDPVDGPLIDPAPVAKAAGATTIFVYLSGGYSVPDSLFGALLPIANRIRIYAPALPSDKLQELARRGAKIDSDPAPLRDVLAAVRVVVHSGGSGVASEALAAGVPQIVLSHQIEQTLNGEALQNARVGRLIEAYGPSAALSPEALAAVCADEALATRAADAGEWHREYLSDKNPALKSERVCMELLGATI